MARHVIGFALLVLLGAEAMAQDVPDGVRYLSAADGINAKAQKYLQEALAAEPYRVARLGPRASLPLFVGPFLSGSLILSGAAKPEEFSASRYIIPLADDIKPQMPAIGAENAAQRAALDAALAKAIPRGTARIRRMTPDEMALIWFYIGWDITEPVFSVEQAGRTLVVDFDETGESVTWIEDISEPCFRVLWDGGGLKDCFCSKTIHKGSQYRVVFEASEATLSCPVAGRPAPVK